MTKLVKTVKLFLAEIILLLLLLCSIISFGQEPFNGWLAVTSLLVYFVWNAFFLFHLLLYLKSTHTKHLPLAFGIWKEIYQQLNVKEIMITHEQIPFKQPLSIIEDFHFFLKAMPDAAIIINKNHQIEWFNSKASYFFALKESSTLKHHVNEVFVNKEIINFIKTNPANTEEKLELASPNIAEIRLLLRLIPYSNNYWMLLASDVSNNYRIEKMRKDFVANVSHELRTPITVISGYLETLKSLYKKDTLLKHPLASMEQQAKRMELIVNDLLTLSSLEAQTPNLAEYELINVPLMLTNIINEYQKAYNKKKHKYIIEIDHNLKIKGNENSLYSVFSNLINNAIRYTDVKGRIQIKWYQEKNIYFSVQDNGVGIAEQHLTHLTERFYRVNKDRSRNSGGSGLGLSIVKHILHRHQAELLIDSKVAQGSTFTCIFKAVDE